MLMKEAIFEGFFPFLSKMVYHRVFCTVFCVYVCTNIYTQTDIRVCLL